MRHHGYATVAQPIELGEPARLEARRDENRIGSALQQMRETLVIADDDADAARIPRGGGGKIGFEWRFARPEQGQARTLPDKTVNTLDEKIHAFLPGQAAHHTEQRPVAFL